MYLDNGITEDEGSRNQTSFQVKHQKFRSQYAGNGSNCSEQRCCIYAASISIEETLQDSRRQICKIEVVVED
jgi:hypothetical protein